MMQAGDAPESEIWGNSLTCDGVCRGIGPSAAPDVEGDIVKQSFTVMAAFYSTPALWLIAVSSLRDKRAVVGHLKVCPTDDWPDLSG